MKRLVDYFIPHVHEGICMAFSGGVDSSVLLAAACKAVKEAGIDKPVLAVTFATRLHPHGDTAEAAEFAKMSGAVHKIIDIDEFSDVRISENPRNRAWSLSPRVEASSDYTKRDIFPARSQNIF